MSLPITQTSGVATVGSNTYSINFEGCPVGPATTPAGPMTTPFVVPAGCPGLARGSLLVETLISSYGASCFPRNLRQYWNCESQMDFYSPAVCPSGYSFVASRSAQGPAVRDGETASICCPSGFVLSGAASICYPTTSTSGSSYFAFQVRWHSTDIPNLTPATPFSTTPTITSSSISQTGSSSRSSSSTSSSITPIPTPAPGLSTGAKAGIGAGVGIAALAAILFLGFFLWRRKKNQNAGPVYHAADNQDRGHDAPQVVYQVEPKPYAAPYVAPYGPDGISQQQQTPIGGVPPYAAAKNVPSLPSLAHAPLQQPSPHSELAAHGSPPPRYPSGMSATLAGGDPRWSNMPPNDPAGLEVVPQDPRADERARIEAELARIEERRQRLRELHILEDEEGQLRRRLQQL